MKLGNRREFLERTMLAAAGAATVASAGDVFAAESTDGQSTAVNERLRVACVGVNGRGTDHIGGFLKRKDAEIAAIVDVDARVGGKRCEEIGKKQGSTPKLYADIRAMLEDKSIDVVTIATPNHTHALLAIWALQAGKHVYVEKPVSHNVSEGRRLVQAAAKHGTICQVGTQSRSNKGMQEAIEFVRGGKIGEVKLARGLCYKPRGPIGDAGPYPLPEGVDYNLWCGPAPLLDYVPRKQFHYDWHWQWEYGNGDLGNQGIHQMDLARWGLGLEGLSKNVFSYGGRFGYVDAGETANTQTIVHDYGDKTLVFEVRGLKTEDYKGAKIGVIWEGSDGYVVMSSYSDGAAFDKDGNKIKDFKGGGDHYGNFVDAIRANDPKLLAGPALEGHLSSALCHTGNISYRLAEGRHTPADAMKAIQNVPGHDKNAETFERFTAHLKDNGVDLDAVKIAVGPQLAFDNATETFPDNSAATAMCTRQYRAPFVVPSERDV